MRRLPFEDRWAAVTYEEQNGEEKEGLESDDAPDPLAPWLRDLIAPLEAPLQQGRRPVDNMIQHRSRNRLKGRRGKGSWSERDAGGKEDEVEKDALRKGWKD